VLELELGRLPAKRARKVVRVGGLLFPERGLEGCSGSDVLSLYLARWAVRVTSIGSEC
jgi:hypothetical protein